jgi:sporulation protein YlmC with PRC-barrel domain
MSLSTLSFYIPQMNKRYCDSEYLTMLFDIEKIGVVSNIEFEPTDENFQKVYIDMKSLCNSEIADQLYWAVLTNNEKTFQYFPKASAEEYWNIQKNERTVVPRLSFYIPQMNKRYCDSEYLTMLFAIEKIGVVSNIEFEPTDENFQKVYIDMKSLCNSEIADELYWAVLTNNEKTFQFFPDASAEEYWNIQKNERTVV